MAIEETAELQQKKFSKLTKKKKLILIGVVLVVVAIIICIVLAVHNAKMRRIEGRYTNPETGDSIKIIYDDGEYILKGKTDCLGDALTYYCVLDEEGDFSDEGDRVYMTFRTYSYWYDEPVGCLYSYDRVEEEFVFDVGEYSETYIKE